MTPPQRIGAWKSVAPDDGSGRKGGHCVSEVIDSRVIREHNKISFFFLKRL